MIHFLGICLRHGRDAPKMTDRLLIPRRRFVEHKTFFSEILPPDTAVIKMRRRIDYCTLLILADILNRGTSLCGSDLSRYRPFLGGRFMKDIEKTFLFRFTIGDGVGACHIHSNAVDIAERGGQQDVKDLNLGHCRNTMKGREIRGEP